MTEQPRDYHPDSRVGEAISPRTVVLWDECRICGERVEDCECQAEET